MNSKTREELTENVIDCIHSLDHSLQQCGGGDGASVEVLKSRTMFDFICHVAAPNGIRFHYEDKKDGDETKETKPSYTSCCPDCGSAKWSDGFQEDVHICGDCGTRWFSDINYKIVCDNCGRGRVGFDGFCRDCNWEQIKTKEDINKIQVHNQP